MNRYILPSVGISAFLLGIGFIIYIARKGAAQIGAKKKKK